MKRIIAISLASCLLLGCGALAQDNAAEVAAEASKLPAPEFVAELELDDDVEEDAEAAEAPEAAEPEAAEAGEEASEDADAGEQTEDAEPAEIPEAEPTEEPAPAEDVEVWFEEGFGLTLPGGWVRYAVSDADGANGIRYALGDGTGERTLYIQFRSEGIDDIEALSQAVENTDGLTKTGDLTFGGTDFVAFIDARQNLSCCATLWGGELAVFMFTPQTDSDYMLTASRIMESFKLS